MNTQYAQYLQWIGVGCTAIVGLCLIIVALLQSRPRRIRAWALVAVAVLEAVAAYLLISTPGITLSVVWMAVLGIIGLVLGWFTGRMTKTAIKDGRVYAQALADRAVGGGGHLHRCCRRTVLRLGGTLLGDGRTRGLRGGADAQPVSLGAAGHRVSEVREDGEAADTGECRAGGRVGRDLDSCGRRRHVTNKTERRARPDRRAGPRNVAASERAGTRPLCWRPRLRSSQHSFRPYP